MKLNILIFSLLFNTVINAKILNYEVQKNDQLGTIFLSLGHKKLWPKDGKINLFKKRIKTTIPTKIWPGLVLKIEENDIIFRKNIKIENDKLVILKKLKTLNEFDEQLKLESLENYEKKTDLKIEALGKPENKNQKTPEYNQSLIFYPAIGFFTAIDNEIKPTLSTSTQTGIQPLLQLKAIYSHENFGSFSTDLLLKKIITDQFNFPLNFDYRLQFLPNIEKLDPVRLAFSHSVIAHSFVGRQSNLEKSYKLSSQFIGLGIIYPMDDHWFEIYLEKAFNGKIEGPGSSIDANRGFRLDSEYIFPLTEKLSMIPGLNYYSIEQNDRTYKLDVYELRLTITTEL